MDRLGALWSLMVSTGLRRGEALGLRWEDVDLHADRLSVVQTASNRAYLSEPKTATGRRSVSLHPEVVLALARHRLRQDEERHLVGSAWQESGLVFTTSIGTLIHPRNVARDFQLAMRRAGARPIRLQALRHTAATLALTSGANPKQVQEMLGHSRVAITLDVYSHVNEEMHAETAMRIGLQFVGAEWGRAARSAWSPASVCSSGPAGQPLRAAQCSTTASVDRAGWVATPSGRTRPPL
ncbi:MAG TPA: site-specific integrase [Acidimicrobiales bacterium]|nr:site-specific integrase [Acidimicrobiales bacterium]